MSCPALVKAINIRLLPVKATYFFSLAAVGSLLLYLPPYMRQAGLDEFESGIIYGTMPFIGAFVRPVFGILADRFHMHKAILILCLILSGLFHAALWGIPHQPISSWKYSANVTVLNLTCDSDGSQFTFCPHNELIALGCRETNETKHLQIDEVVINEIGVTAATPGGYKVTHHDYPDPLAGIENCTLECLFNHDNDLNELCLKKDNDTHICPISKKSRTATVSPFLDGLSDLVGDFNHKLYVARFQMALLVEKLKYLGAQYHKNLNASSTSPYDVCHKYVASEFDYEGIHYDHDTMFSCDLPATLTCVLVCSKPPANLTDTPGYDCTVKTKSEFGRAFWTFFFVFLLAQIFFSPIFSLIDGIVYDYLGEERGKWGKSRMFGTIGFIIFGFSSGFLMDVYEGDDGEKNYLPAFILYPVLSLVAAVTVCFYTVSDEIHASQVFDHLFSLFKSLKIVVFLIIVLLFGIDTGVIETFLFFHLLDIGSSQLLLGLCMVMNCLLEIVLLFFAGTIIKRLGHILCFFIVFIAYFTRLFAYAYLTNPWAVLAIEPLHSITFGLFFATASSYGSIITPPGLHGTIQGLIGGIFFGLGKGIGGTTGGKIFRDSGAHTTFLCYAILTVVVFVIYALMQFFWFRTVFTGRYTKGSTDEPKDEIVDSDVNVKSPSYLYNAIDDLNQSEEMLVIRDGTFQKRGDNDDDEQGDLGVIT